MEKFCNLRSNEFTSLLEKNGKNYIKVNTLSSYRSTVLKCYIRMQKELNFGSGKQQLGTDTDYLHFLLSDTSAKSSAFSLEQYKAFPSAFTSGVMFESTS